MEYKYRFSVVIPVYHVADYLAETLDSVISQDIGFTEHIQVILVNDGSPDDSESICLSYQKRYPHNIVYVKQENAGVSAARNPGVKYVEGKYVNFLDAEDKWAKNSFRAVFEFFEKHYEKIDLVSCRQKFFETRDEYHWLAFKYENGSRIIDILDKYNYIQMHVTASFVKAEVLARHSFDENLKFSEDAKFVNSVILDKLKYGVVSDALHFYRKRVNASSAVQNKGVSKEWYLDTPRHYYLELIQESLEKYGTVLLYVQYLILYDFQWRLRDDPSRVLTEEEQEWYEQCLKEMLDHMDDDIICHLDKMYVEYKIFALSLKYGRDIRRELKYRKGSLYFHHIKIYSFQAKSLFSVDVLEVKEGMLHLSGRIWCPFAEETDFYFQNERGEQFPIRSKPAGFRKAVVFGREIMRVRGYEVRLPLAGVREYQAYVSYQKRFPQRLYIRIGKFSHLSQEVEELYYHEGGCLFGYEEEEGKICIRRKRFFPHLAKELRLLGRCVKDKKYEIVWYLSLIHI